MFELIPVQYNILGAFLASLLISIVSIPSIVKVALLKHLFDEPDERTVHSYRIPTLGGLAVFSGFTVSSLFFCDIITIPELRFIIAGTIILFFIGIMRLLSLDLLFLRNKFLAWLIIKNN